MGHSAFGLTMGYQEPVLELPVVYLFDSPSLRPQKLVAPRDVTEYVYEVLRNDLQAKMASSLLPPLT